jgi:hypothetical protein
MVNTQMSPEIMPKGLKREKLPADVVGSADGGEVKPSSAANRIEDGKTGGAVTTKSTPSNRRKEIAKAAARPRWEG